MEITDRKSLLNRSISSPNVSMQTPICRRIYMEEFYYPKKDLGPIRREYTCEQIIDNTKFLNSKPQFDATFFQNQLVPSAIQKYPSVNSLCLETSVNHNDSPMDIDIETSQNNTPIIVDDDIKIEEDFEELKPTIASTPNILDNCKMSYRGRVPILLKKDKITTKNKEAKVPTRSYRCFKIFLAVLLVLMCMYLIKYYDQTFYDRTINVDKIRLELEGNVINQDEQISQVVEYLELVSTRRIDLPKNILTFFGTNGVGKSFVANLIKKHFKPSQVFDFDLNRDLIVSSDFHRNVPYLLILDNLRVSDLARLNSMLMSLPNSQIITILIFNNQYLHESGEFYVNSWEAEEVKKGISENFNVHFVRFNSFNKSILRGLLRNIDMFEEVFEGHDFEGVGFKGFFAKVLLINPDLQILFK